MTKKKPTSKQIVDMDSGSGVLADLFQGVQWGPERAGRSTAMAKAIGKDPGFMVQNPRTSDAIGTLLGGITGAGAGLAAADLAGGGRDVSPLALSGGALLGGIAGSVLTTLLRRRRMKQIGKDFDAAKTIKPVDSDQPGFLRGLVTPLSGAHHVGEAKAVAQLRGQIPDSSVSSTAHHLGGAAEMIPYAGPLLQLGRGWAQNATLGQIGKKVPDDWRDMMKKQYRPKDD